MTNLKIRKKDTVLVIAGRDKGKKGEVLKVYPEKGRVLVAKVNIITKHAKPRPPAEPGGIQKRESPIHASNVMLLCPKCEQPVRAKNDKLSSGERVRVCRKCSEVIL
jgi:large subunit ribosomal protein L24